MVHLKDEIDLLSLNPGTLRTCIKSVNHEEVVLNSTQTSAAIKCRCCIHGLSLNEKVFDPTDTM